jgi:MFS family permease
MDSRVSSDPFVRNRHRWAWALWIAAVVFNADDARDGWQGLGAVVLTVIFWGVLAYMLGSHKDRESPDFWRPLIGAWVLIMLATAVWTLAVGLVGTGLDWRYLWPFIFNAFLLELVVTAYRRTSAGLLWRRSKAEQR